MSFKYRTPAKYANSPHYKVTLLPLSSVTFPIIFHEFWIHFQTVVFLARFSGIRGRPWLGFKRYADVWQKASSGCLLDLLTRTWCLIIGHFTNVGAKLNGVKRKVQWCVILYESTRCGIMGGLRAAHRLFRRVISWRTSTVSVVTIPNT